MLLTKQNKTVKLKNYTVILKKRTAKIFYFISIVCLPNFVVGQKVGLVLSGGGAAGLTHIGVIKALEENNIPIDYIAGTSMGALIGGMYASGYSVKEIEDLFESELFMLSVNGQIPAENIFYYKQADVDASLVEYKVSSRSLLQTSIPTNIVATDLMNFLFMELFSKSAAVAGYNFDSLMIPFRCNAADIVDKKQVIFRKGDLSTALRATTTYPFYFKPITVDGKLLFDGGLYNNFPTDIMYTEFYPDIIIGSNVSTNSMPPDENDLISQIKNMIIYRTEYSMVCENGIIILPETDVGLFDFSNVKAEIDKGYNATIKNIDEIKKQIKSRRTNLELEKKRLQFRFKETPLLFDKISVQGINEGQTKYVEKIIFPHKRDSILTVEKFKPLYFRLTEDDKIKSVFPTMVLDDNGKYTLKLAVGREKDISTYFGGNFSSKPSNFGFVGLKYNFFGKTSASIYANSYFGKFYGSINVRLKLDLATGIQFSFEPFFTLNRWDYFRSLATFFEPSNPSYIIQNEIFGGAQAYIPAGNRGKLGLDFKFGITKDDYYQTEKFTRLDTSDVTNFQFITSAINYERSTLNKKQFANKGTYLNIKIRGVSGRETTQFGTTLPSAIDYKKDHSWVTAEIKYENYFKRFSKIQFGIFSNAVYSTKSFFENYDASVLSSPAFQPIPETKTIFQNEFRAHKYGAFGLRAIYVLQKNVDVRLEGYVFQPVNEFKKDANNHVVFDTKFKTPFFIASSNLVFHSPIGPVSLSLNYYDKAKDPLRVIFNFGFLIFNKRALE